VPFAAGLRFTGVALPLLALAGALAGVLAPLACWPIATGLDTPAAFAAAALGNSKLPLRRQMLTGAATGWGAGWGTSLQERRTIIRNPRMSKTLVKVASMRTTNGDITLCSHM
jgi:hypothetical protein